MKAFEPEQFVNAQVKKMQEIIGKEKALIAVSGGVDSSTCAVLTHKAIGNNLVCVMLDDAFMREGEPERVAQLLGQPPLNLPMRVVNVRSRFLRALRGLRDAEEKRKAFRETFYKVLGETAKKENCRLLVQGTILADIQETTGGIKTQHNVLEQMGINPLEKFGFKIVEPLASLYKEQVRMVARYLGIPKEISERQPFPGPGLSVRVVGRIKSDKLQTLKKATAIAEAKLAQHKPSQYFAVIMDNVETPQNRSRRHIQETVARSLNVPARNVAVKIFLDKATGIKGGRRIYGDVACVKVQEANGRIYRPSIKMLEALQTKIVTENPSFTRVFYAVNEKERKQPYVIALRAIQTVDFLTAEVSNIPWVTLGEIADEILKKCPKVACVCYDVTPKPPATVEME
ncbi:MAG: ATP-binding protein [Candidatus Bathyarchaeia archaeon]|jgi:GMP synthase (glutamine-hydrolysing)|nr:GMP synthase [Candidatus Bathyarchaeota archaeon A05DMB-4]MDH7595724.1 ATP-binding protein [Candidatus Bathyarchaeota archaeon]